MHYKYRLDISFQSEGERWVEDDCTYGDKKDANIRGEHILKRRYTAAKRFKIVMVKPVWRLYSFLGDPDTRIEFKDPHEADKEQRHLHNLHTDNRYEVHEEWTEVGKEDESPDTTGQATD